MKLVKLLSSVIVENTSDKLINEISEKLKKTLVDKFKSDTGDSEEIIAQNIDYFDRIKNGLPAEKRDITKYNYGDLSAVVKMKKASKAIEDTFSNFKKKEPKTDNKDLKQNIRMFFDIQNFLQKAKQDINKYTFLDLVKLNKQNWEKLVTSKAFEKFQKEKPNLLKDQILFYVDSYLENFNQLPENTPSIFNMTFEDLEHLIDGLEGKKQGKSGKKDYSGIDVVYDDDNLLIFNPKTKDQCIKLRNGRSWCTSREGGSNLYYNYRLENNLTLYYVIDQDKDFGDLNYATVILVDKYGKKRLADGSNSGRYAGSTVLPWNEISGKVEKLANLEDLFEPKPLSDEEQDLLRKYRGKRVSEDPIKELGGEQEAELWLEMNSPRLTDIQYKNLTPNLQKKYIALGMDLSGPQISMSPPEVINYYISKKLESVKNKKLNDLNDEDIALLNLKVNSKVKEDLKPKYVKELMYDKGQKNDTLEIVYPKSDKGKFITLYGFDEIFNSVPTDLRRISIKNESKSPIALDIPSSLGKFTNLESIHFENILKSLPEDISKLKDLQIISISNNPELKELPKGILDLPKLEFIIARNNTMELPEGFDELFSETNKGFFNRNHIEDETE